MSSFAIIYHVVRGKNDEIYAGKSLDRARKQYRESVKRSLRTISEPFEVRMLHGTELLEHHIPKVYAPGELAEIARNTMGTAAYRAACTPRTEAGLLEARREQTAAARATRKRKLEQAREDPAYPRKQTKGQLALVPSVPRTIPPLPPKART